MRIPRTPRGIITAMSERRDGEMGFTDGLVSSRVLSNRKKFLKKCGLLGFRLVRVAQVHGNTVHVVGEKVLKTEKKISPIS